MAFKIAANCDWREDDFKELKDSFRKLGLFYVEGQNRNPPIYIDEFNKGIKAIHSLEPSSKNPCGAGRGVTLVDPRGDFWPCHRFGPHQCNRGFQLGSLGAPFNNRMRRVFLTYFRDCDTLAECSKCPAVVTCRSWCYAECVDSTRSLYDPGSTYCLAVQIISNEVLLTHHLLREKSPRALRAIVSEGE